MKINFLVLLFSSFLVSVVCQAQVYQYKYYLDKDFNSIEKSKAIILGKGINEDGLFRLDCFTKDGKSLYIKLHFTDSSLSQLQGSMQSFHLNGKLEQQGFFSEGLENGIWEKWDSLGRKSDSIMFKNGHVMNEVLFRYYPKGTIEFLSIKDSLENTYKSFSYDSLGVILYKAFFVGEKGIVTSIKNGREQTDSVFSRKLKEAEFPGGIKGWTTYLKSNLDAMIGVENGAKEGVYTVIIRFTVKRDGSITDVFPETHHGHKMEKEAIRVIEKGPNWIPAERYGQKIEEIRRQPVTFVYANE